MNRQLLYDDDDADEMELSSTPPMPGCYDDVLEEYEREKYVPCATIQEARMQLAECIAYYNANAEHVTTAEIQEIMLMIVDARDELRLFVE